MKNTNLKKKIGEKAYQYLIRNFNDDFLQEHLTATFFNLSEIRDIQESEYNLIKKLLNEKLEDKTEKQPIDKTAHELLDKAGFMLFDDIKTQNEYQKFKKYYQSNEQLCKFGGYDATDRYSRVFWILRKNIDSIARPDKPSRQDEYSTSCMSVGISRDKQSVQQITSRYNHIVSGCDNTYNSNLDNIVEGLTEAFNKDYNLNINNNNSVEFTNFYFLNNQYYYYSHEINGKKFGNNTVDGVYYDKSKFLIFDTYLLDLQERKITNFCDGYTDSFVTIVQNKLDKGDKIEIRKGDLSTIDDDDNKIIICT